MDIIGAINHNLEAAGVQSSARVANGYAEVTLTIPTNGRPTRVKARVPLDQFDTVGGEVGAGKIAKKIKKAAGKAFKVVTKIAAPLANVMVPGAGTALQAAAKLASKAGKLKTLAKRGSPQAKKLMTAPLKIVPKASSARPAVPLAPKRGARPAPPTATRAPARKAAPMTLRAQGGASLAVAPPAMMRAPSETQEALDQAALDEESTLDEPIDMVDVAPPDDLDQVDESELDIVDAGPPDIEIDGPPEVIEGIVGAAKRKQLAPPKGRGTLVRAPVRPGPKATPKIARPLTAKGKPAAAPAFKGGVYKVQTPSGSVVSVSLP